MTGAVIAAINAVALRLVSLVADMGLDATYSDSNTSPSNVTNTITVTFLEDGTWTVVGNGEVLPNDSGSWGTPTTPGAGVNYEIEIVDNTGAGGGGSVSGMTGAGVWASMQTGRAMTLSVSDSTLDNGAENADRSFTATIRKVGTSTPTSTDTFTLDVQANKTSA